MGTYTKEQLNQELNRIKSATADCIDAIKQRNVMVADNAKLADLHKYINFICDPDEYLDISWIGNGSLEYQTGSDASSRMTRMDASANVSNVYFSLPMEVATGNRIETEVYLDKFYQDYWGAPTLHTSTLPSLPASAGYKAWAYSTQNGSTVLYLNNECVSASYDNSFMQYLKLMEFSFATIRYTEGSLSASSPDYWKGAGLGFYGNYGVACSTSVADGTAHEYEAARTKMFFWGDDRNGRVTKTNDSYNKFFPVSLTFGVKSLRTYLKLDVDCGSFVHYSGSTGQANYSWTTAGLHLDSAVSGTYNMRVFDQTYKGFRFKYFREYDSNNNLIKNYIPRLHYGAAVNKVVPCWFETTTNRYYYPQGSVDIDRDLNYNL